VLKHERQKIASIGTAKTAIQNKLLIDESVISLNADSAS
jgi:hypothetical protein